MMKHKGKVPGQTRYLSPPFIGKVEDVAGDPLQLGRVRVRIFNENDVDVPTPVEHLQWCNVMMPMTSASLSGVGTSPTWVEVGTYVLGIYLDGETKRQPLILGTYPKIPGMDINKHDVSSLARGTNVVVKDLTGPEPDSAYSAEYPHNKVIQTPTGHVIEIDDTPGAERIHVFHKSGTYLEIDHEGRTVRKSVGKDFTILVQDSEVHVGGNVNVHVVGNATVKVDGSYTLEAGQEITLKAPRINLN